MVEGFKIRRRRRRRSKFSPTPTTPAMTVPDYVAYNAEYKVLICRSHKYAIAPDYIARHLRDSHKGISLQTRQAIVDYSKTLELAAPEDITMSSNPVQYIKDLTIVNGFQCVYDGCLELRSTEGSMKEHCKKKHRWLTAEGIKWRKQDFQTIFDSNRRK
jgi:Orsellinic acid/F9775 biosynthesis cluster protein D